MTNIFKKKIENNSDDLISLAHTKWNFKYHIVFTPKYSLKYKFGQRSFWCRGYYVDTVGKNEKAIAEYAKNQLKEDMMYDQISIKEYINTFKDKNK